MLPLKKVQQTQNECNYVKKNIFIGALIDFGIMNVVR